MNLVMLIAFILHVIAMERRLIVAQISPVLQSRLFVNADVRRVPTDGQTQRHKSIEMDYLNSIDEQRKLDSQKVTVSQLLKQLVNLYKTRSLTKRLGIINNEELTDKSLAYFYRTDFGKRAAPSLVYPYRTDFGKRDTPDLVYSYPTDFGKRATPDLVYNHRTDFGKRAANPDLIYNYRTDFGKRAAPSLAYNYRTDFGRRASQDLVYGYRTDFGKRAIPNLVYTYRSDFDRRTYPEFDLASSRLNFDKRSPLRTTLVDYKRSNESEEDSSNEVSMEETSLSDLE